jgi:hypothetical protein
MSRRRLGRLGFRSFFRVGGLGSGGGGLGLGFFRGLRFTGLWLVFLAVTAEDPGFEKPFIG